MLALDAAGQVVGEREFRHGGAGLAALCDWLVSVAGEPGSVAVAIEVPHGPVVDALLDRGFAVHAIVWLGRRMTDAMLGSRQVGCARTRTCSGPSRPATLP
jgi:hypothetical protein